MTKKDIKEIVSKAIENSVLCSIKTKFRLYNDFIYPLKMNDKLFISAIEDDFIINGFKIMRFKDVERTEYKDGKFCEIGKAENILDSIDIPDIDITDWKSVLTELSDKNIIIECEDTDENNSGFYIGRVEKICSSFLYFRHFDADAIWENEPYKIKYSSITSITFDSRYITVFSKYLPPLPDNFGK